MVDCVSILGSTGSIGRQSLDIISRLPVKVAALTAGTSVERMAQQCRQFQPELAVMGTQDAAEELKRQIADLETRVSWGEEGLIDHRHFSVDVVCCGECGLRLLDDSHCACHVLRILCRHDGPCAIAGLR